MTKLSVALPPEERMELAEIFAAAEALVRRGRAAFFDRDDPTNRNAGAFLVIRTAACARRLPESVVQQFPGVPWSAIRGARNRAAHYGFDFDFEIVWSTVVDALPAMRRALSNPGPGNA